MHEVHAPDDEPEQHPELERDEPAFSHAVVRQASHPADVERSDDDVSDAEAREACEAGLFRPARDRFDGLWYPVHEAGFYQHEAVPRAPELSDERELLR